MNDLHKPADPLIGTFSDDQLARVLQAYGRPDFIVLPFLTLNGSILDLRRRTDTARKVIVECAGSVLFLKELPWYCASPEFAAFETAFCRKARAAGAPVPAIVPTHSGEDYFQDRRTGSLFVLQEYRSGRSWRGELSEARAAGETLAVLHTVATMDLAPLPSMRDVFGSAGTLVSLLFDGWTGEEPDEVHRWASRALETIRRHRNSAVGLGYGSRPIPVHGDYNPFNLVFEEHGSGVTAVVDFDNACLDDPAHDVGEALIRFAWMKYRGLSSSYGAVPTEFEQAVVNAVLDGYHTGGTLSNQTLDVLPDVMTAVALELSAIGLLSGYYKAADLPALDRNITRLPSLSRAAVRSSVEGMR